MATPVDLAAQAEAHPDVPLVEYLLETRRLLRAAFEYAWPTLQCLKERLTTTGLDAPDAELAFHELWLREVEDVVDELGKEAGRAREISRLRIATTLDARGATGFVACGKTFDLDADLVPSPPPATKEPAKHAEFLAWMAENGYDALIRRDVPWPTLQKLVNDRAAAGLAGPPHVRLSPKFVVRVR